MTIAPERIAEIEARCAAATAGPWELAPQPHVLPAYGDKPDYPWNEWWIRSGWEHPQVKGKFFILCQGQGHDGPVVGIREEDAAFIAHARQDLEDLLNAYKERGEELERALGRLKALEEADWCDTSDADLGRQFKDFATKVEAASEKQWRGGDAERRLGLMSLGINQAIVMAAESNAETFTYTATGMQTGGKPLGDWTVTVARAGAEIPADVAALVLAARSVAFGEPDKAAIKRLDAASEAFADRVPWDDEPRAKGDV
jgi:hypothetical protein